MTSDLSGSGGGVSEDGPARCSHDGLSSQYPHQVSQGPQSSPHHIITDIM